MRSQSSFQQQVKDTLLFSHLLYSFCFLTKNRKVEQQFVFFLGKTALTFIMNELDNTKMLFSSFNYLPQRQHPLCK